MTNPDFARDIATLPQTSARPMPHPISAGAAPSGKDAVMHTFIRASLQAGRSMAIPSYHPDAVAARIRANHPGARIQIKKRSLIVRPPKTSK